MFRLGSITGAQKIMTNGLEKTRTLERRCGLINNSASTLNPGLFCNHLTGNFRYFLKFEKYVVSKAFPGVEISSRGSAGLVEGAFSSPVIGG